MRIAVIGWYNNQNFGDDRILESLKGYLSADQLIPFSSISEAMNNLNAVNACDCVLFGGGGLILRGMNQYVPLLQGLYRPLGCIGLGVEIARHPDSNQFLDLLIEKSLFIHVRDYGSAANLLNHRKIVIGHDLTFLTPYEVIGSSQSDICGINLRPWRFWAGEHNGAFDRFMSRLAHLRGLRFIYPFPQWRPHLVADILKSEFRQILPLPFYTPENCRNDIHELRRYGFSESQNDMIDDFRKCGIIVGMRFHAVVFAIQMGIPFVSLSYQPKNEELCKRLGLPDLSVDIYSRSAFRKALQYSLENRDSIRERLLKYRSEAQADLTNSIPKLMNELRNELSNYRE
ncbi:MAG: hypothetical protein CVV64_13070 [Candidatus Wallbacteria bacterium HGW-Wallbacteria-1]|jgi:polysaccharide pyruvyl transferase WcaK-like protein|uniref:Polysaccharide pyruvyl transferase domain-containing protein n=1 Tax=Candidatus Wallbacteria bacterium HGW-Wallbacteria-1 TaxID=2013854 RepID=A0A2N1PN33_9BACT|nr:MAG: hypothetical protein CVV64_13070 [Candidatus Wallbacteria bacterium HGW-Wallbacteria-1]